MSENKIASIGAVISVFLGCVFGLALTPIVTTTVIAVAATMTAGAAKSILELVPLFWVIFLVAIPVVNIVVDVRESMGRGGIDLGTIVKVLLPTIVGLSLTGTINTQVATAVVNLTTGATKTMLELFPLFWIIYLIGIPVTAIAVYFVSK